jgi:hypothetical protein
MFAAPICRRRWRNNAFRSVSSDEDGGSLANIAASGARIKQSAIRSDQDCAPLSPFPAAGNRVARSFVQD